MSRVLVLLTYPSHRAAYAGLALTLYGGASLGESQAPGILRLYCMYLPFLALNGLTEVSA
jgi:hypothetical protein